MPDTYLEKEGRALVESSPVAAQDLPFEFLLNALRLPAGVSEQLFSDHTGLDLAALEPQRTALVERGLLEPTTGRLCCTPMGLDYLNEVLQAFMPDLVRSRH